MCQSKILNIDHKTKVYCYLLLSDVQICPRNDAFLQKIGSPVKTNFTGEAVKQFHRLTMVNW